jgi:hypothetical protein
VHRVPWGLALAVAGAALLVQTTALLGVHHPWLVLPLVLVVLVLAGLVAARLPLRGSPADAAAVLVLLPVLAAWVAWNATVVSELFIVGRDASIFTLSAFWLRDNPSSVIDLLGGFGNSEGFSRGEGVLYSQNTHAVPAFAATVSWVAGTTGLLAANLLVAAGAACAVFVVARLVGGPWPALVVTVALLLGLPFLAFSRAPYTEPLTMLFVWLGTGVLLVAVRARASSPWWWLAGALLGGAAAVRVDGLLAVVGVVPVLALHLGLSRRTSSLAVLPTTLRVLGGAAVTTGLGYLDLLETSPDYLRTLREEVTLVTAGGTASVVLALLLAAAVHRPAGAAAARRVAAALATPVTVVVAVLVGIGVAGPILRDGRWLDPAGPYARSVALRQQLEGLPVDGTRSYDERLWWWLAWYHGWVVVLLAAVALVLVSRRWLTRHTVVFLVVAVVLPSLLVYSVRVSITPDQIWASRRALPVLIPAFLVLTSWQLGRLLRSGPQSRLVAAAVSAAVVLAPLSLLPGVAGVAEDRGSRAAVEDLCALTEGRQVVVTGARSIAGTLRTVCANPVGVLFDAVVDPGEMLAGLHRMGADGAVVVSTQAGSVPWEGGVAPPPRIDAERTLWSRSLLGAPRTTEVAPIRIWVGVAQPDGTVRPLEPSGP